ncbi:MAG TPA: hypothetical protein VLL97_10275 [Acidobacteriota bacterium]|nr:hypothetical protein [Acidobacteriota bacterium]
MILQLPGSAAGEYFAGNAFTIPHADVEFVSDDVAGSRECTACPELLPC